MRETIAEKAVSLIIGSPSLISCRRMPLGFANANYRLETSAGTFLLRHCLNRDISDVAFELKVYAWLARHGFPAPKVIRLANGQRWFRDPGDTAVFLMEWLEGSEPVPSPSCVATIGQALGHLHRLPIPNGNWWRRKNPTGIEFAAGLAGHVRAQDDERFHFFNEAFVRLQNQLDDSLPRGFIHGDLFTDNTIFDGDRLVAVLDFEAACEDALVYDVAMAVHGFCYSNERWSPDLAGHLLAGYGEARPLDERERNALPHYLCWCPLMMMGWHLEALRRRPNERNAHRAAQFARRVREMMDVSWRP